MTVQRRGRHRKRRSRQRRVLAAVLAAGAVTSGVVGVRLLDGIGLHRPSEVGDVPAAAGTGPGSGSPSKSPTPAATSSPGSAATPTRAPVLPGVPTRLTLPAAKVTAAVVPVGTRPDGQLRLPDSPKVVGWWVRSAPIGDPKDATVLAGHVDSAEAGLGALAALRDMKVGDRLLLVDAFGGRHEYRLEARRAYAKYALPDDVFAVSGRARLVLITCGGPFDEEAGRYRDNVVGYAVPA